MHQSLTVHNLRYQVVQIVKANLSDVHAYADDIQLFLLFKLGSHTNPAEAVGALEECLEDKSGLGWQWTS